MGIQRILHHRSAADHKTSILFLSILHLRRATKGFFSPGSKPKRLAHATTGPGAYEDPQPLDKKRLSAFYTDDSQLWAAARRVFERNPYKDGEDGQGDVKKVPLRGGFSTKGYSQSLEEWHFQGRRKSQIPESRMLTNLKISCIIQMDPQGYRTRTFRRPCGTG